MLRSNVGKPNKMPRWIERRRDKVVTKLNKRKDGNVNVLPPKLCEVSFQVFVRDVLLWKACKTLTRIVLKTPTTIAFFTYIRRSMNVESLQWYFQNTVPYTSCTTVGRYSSIIAPQSLPITLNAPFRCLTYLTSSLYVLNTHENE